MTFKSQLREASKTVSVDLSTVYHDVIDKADPEAYMALPYKEAKHLMAQSRATLFPKGLSTAEEITEYLELNRDNESAIARSVYQVWPLRLHVALHGCFKQEDEVAG